MAKKITATAHTQIIHGIISRLSELGLNQSAIGYAVEYSQSNISQVLSKVEQCGGLANYEVGQSSGRPAHLSAAERRELKALLERGAKANGFPHDGWTRSRIQAFIKARFGVDYSMPHISRLMKQLGYSLQQPVLQDTRRRGEQVRHYEEQTLPELKKNS